MNLLGEAVLMCNVMNFQRKFMTRIFNSCRELKIRVRTISRVLYLMIIYLDLTLPTGSSDLPKDTAGYCIVFYLVLLRMGFTYALSVTRKAVGSYPAIPPLPGNTGGIFLLHWPWSHLHRTLSGILPYEARTFLT